MATRTARPSAKVADRSLWNRPARIPGIDHHRRLLRGHTDSLHSRRRAGDREPDPAEQCAVSERDEDRRRRLRGLREDLVRDRAVPLVLSRLRAVLEEREALL